MKTLGIFGARRRYRRMVRMKRKKAPVRSSKLQDPRTRKAPMPNSKRHNFPGGALGARLCELCEPQHRGRQRMGWDEHRTWVRATLLRVADPRSGAAL